MGNPTAEENSVDSSQQKVKKPPEFEDILDVVGHFGWYQLIMFLLLSSTDFGAGMAMLFFIFSNYVPEWRCLAYEGNKTFDDLGGNYSDEWRHDMTNCYINGSSCRTYEFRGDISMVTEWDLLCDYSYIPKLTVSCQFFGLIVGAATFGQLSDMYGRKRIGLITQIGMVASQLLVGLSVNWYMFAAFRCMVGFFTAGVMGIFTVYPQEFVGPKWRPCVSSIGFFSIGHCVMSLMAMYLQNYRHLAYAIALLPVPFIVLIGIICPESPRWLIQKHRFKEAEDIVRKMALKNGRPLPDLSIIPEIAKTEMARDCQQTNLGFRDLFRGPIMIRRSIVSCILWFSVSEVYYGIVVMVNTFSGSVHLNSIYSALTTYPLVWLSLPIVTWVGRKKCFILFTFLTVGAMFTIVVLYAVGAVPRTSWIVMALSLFGKGAVVAVWTLTALVTVEIYPTLLRNIGCGLGNAMARVGGMLSPQFLLLGMYTHWTVPYLVHGTLILVAVILAFMILPETGEISLPEDVPDHKPVSEKQDIELNNVLEENSRF